MNWHLFFLDLALRGLLISGAAALAVWCLRGRFRTVICALSLWALLVLPAAQMLPRWEVTLPDAGTVARVSAWATSWTLPVSIWGLGFTLIAGRLLPGFWRLRQWRRDSQPITDERVLHCFARAKAILQLKVNPALRLAAPGTMPVACGWWRATVFIPEDALAWDDERLHMVLLHELAHLRRGDPAMQTLSHVACALHWFNPLVWMLQRTWLREREMATDVLVLSTGVAPRGYAMHLVEIAERFRTGVPAMVPAAAMAGPGLEMRVRSILQYVPLAPSRGVAAVLVLTACAAVTAFATMMPRPIAPQVLPPSFLQIEVERRLTAEPFPADGAGPR